MFRMKIFESIFLTLYKVYTFLYKAMLGWGGGVGYNSV